MYMRIGNKEEEPLQKLFLVEKQKKTKIIKARKREKQGRGGESKGTELGFGI